MPVHETSRKKKMYVLVMFFTVASVLFLAVCGHSLEDVLTDRRRQKHSADARPAPTVKWMEAAETTITVRWNSPLLIYGADFCMLAYKEETNPVTIRIPVTNEKRIYLIRGLKRNTLYEIRLYCLYGGEAGRTTRWFRVATRTVSANPSVCPGRLLHATLEPICLERPEYSSCEFTCKDGFRKSDVPDVIRGHRSKTGNTIVTIFCSNGKWVTNNEDLGYGISDLCLHDVFFLKCPLTIPNGVLEPHCGPATDWLCRFDCNSGTRRHPYMRGTLKGFEDEPYMLYCEDGTWKTGYEALGVGVFDICRAPGQECTNSDEIPNGSVLYLHCADGYSCGFECDTGFHKHALVRGDPYCENGHWALMTTKYDSSITIQTLCVPDDSRGVCSRTIPNGHIADSDCSVNCRPQCDEGYYVPDSPGPRRMSCEGGKWLTDEVPYTGDNICFPQGGHLCPQEIPNGFTSEIEHLRADDGSTRLRTSYQCNEGFRRHFTITQIECIAGEWVTGQERVGWDVSKLCIPYTP